MQRTQNMLTSDTRTTKGTTAHVFGEILPPLRDMEFDLTGWRTELADLQRGLAQGRLGTRKRAANICHLRRCELLRDLPWTKGFAMLVFLRGTTVV